MPVRFAFTKMQGLGNDYVYVDLFDHPNFPTDAETLGGIAKNVSNRHFGIGSDGLILIGPGNHAPFKMRMFNSDGSESAMCGNGLRCVAKFVSDHHYLEKFNADCDAFLVESGAGVHRVEIVGRDEAARVAQVRLDMGEPGLSNAQIPTAGPADERLVDAPIDVRGTEFRITGVSMGNPHAVIFVDDADRFPVHVHGPQIETLPFFPARTNVEFVTVKSPTELVQRTWERGAGETLACGSGACAVLVAAHLTGRAERKATIHLRGGDLIIEWDEASNHVFKTGPAVHVFSGHITV